jgi:hypothetical protein
MSPHLPLLAACLALAADKGAITGTLTPPRGVTAVRAIDRSGEMDKVYKGKVDRKTGKFTIPNLPPGTYDVVVDAGAARLEGVNLKVKPPEDEEDRLTKEDVKQITKIAKALNKFENEVDVMVVAGNGQYAAALLNKRRTTPFYESKPGEMIWRLELWHFLKPEESWVKDPDELGIVLYRERLQKAAFARKSLTLDPALGGIEVTPKRKNIDLGKVAVPDGKRGIRLRK